MSARRCAILISQDRFPEDDDLGDLSYARSDANAVAGVLEHEDGSTYDLVEKVENGTHHQALRKIERITADLFEDDFLFVYYSGHGLVGSNDKLHLAFENTEARLLNSTAMKAGTLLDILDDAKPSARLLVLDCCYAGAIGAEFKRSSIEDAVRIEASSHGTFVMTSATSSQVAKESPVYGQGVFTKHLVDGLNGAADLDGDGRVSADELFSYVRKNTMREGRQEPRRFNIDAGSSLILRETGHAPHDELIERITHRLHELHREKQLAPSVVSEAIAQLDRRPYEMTDVEQARFGLLKASLEDPFIPGSFMEQWERTRQSQNPNQSTVGHGTAETISNKKPKPDPDIGDKSDQPSNAHQGKASTANTTETAQNTSSDQGGSTDQSDEKSTFEQIADFAWKGALWFFAIIIVLAFLGV